jgi:hypothetical protein
MHAPFDAFGSEQCPLSAFIINDAGGILSRSEAKRKGRYDRNKSLWDDAPRFIHPTHNKVYSRSGILPDEAAQAAFDAGILREPCVSAMWRILAAESNTARNVRRTAPAEIHTKSTHGGQRPGAGRPDKGVARYNVTLDPAIVEAVRHRTSNMSGLIDSLLRQYLAAAPF